MNIFSKNCSPGPAFFENHFLFKFFKGFFTESRKQLFLGEKREFLKRMKKLPVSVLFLILSTKSSKIRKNIHPCQKGIKTQFDKENRFLQTAKRFS